MPADLSDQFQRGAAQALVSAHPLPALVRVAVVKVWRLETQRMIETGGEEFDPTRYDRLVEQIFAGTHSTNRHPAPTAGA